MEDKSKIGIQSNQNAFAHYVRTTQSYTEKVLGGEVENPEFKDTQSEASEVPRQPIKEIVKELKEVSKEPSKKNKREQKMASKITIQTRSLPVESKTPNAHIDFRQVSIFTWNINGMRAIIKKNRLQEFFERAKADIICL